jgi:hypothetical protein
MVVRQHSCDRRERGRNEGEVMRKTNFPAVAISEDCTTFYNSYVRRCQLLSILQNILMTHVIGQDTGLASGSLST